MGKEMPKKEDEEGDENELEVAVEVEQITVNTDDKPKFTSAMLQAVAQTTHLDPHTLGELQDAMAERTTALKNALKELGVNIMFKTSMTMHVKISHMMWHVSDKSSIHNSSITEQKSGEQLKFT
jgi:diadenosine tetraphosphate (Ap4A) HIT family hydrolase